MAANDARKARMAGKIVMACGGSVAGATVAVLGYAFKPDTDDTRETPAREIVAALLGAGARVHVYDPAARCDLKGAETAETVETALTGADAMVAVTEWSRFRGLDPARIAQLLRRPVVVDLRNIYRPEAMRAAGLHYVGIGEGAPRR